MTTKNLKQEDLLKKQKRTAKKPENPLAASLNAFKSTQSTETIKYRDANDRPQSRKVVLTNPGISYSTHLLGLLYTDDPNDKVAAYKYVMDNVVANPKLSFDTEDRKLPKSLRTKKITYSINKVGAKIPLKNQSGQKVSINLKWPGLRTALYIINTEQTNSGAIRLTPTLNLMNSYVFKDNQGRGVKDSYWNAGGHCSGLGLFAIGEATNYLTTVLDYNGYNSIIQKGISFLTTELR